MGIRRVDSPNQPSQFSPFVCICVSFEGRSKKDYKQHQVFSCLGGLN